MKTASSGGHRSEVLTAGGVLCIIGGLPQIVYSAVLIEHYLASLPRGWMLMAPLFLPFLPGIWPYYQLWGLFPSVANSASDIGWVVMVGCTGILGIVAAIGGVSAIRRRSFGLSLAGAICAFVWVPLGIAAIVLIVLGQREFRAQLNSMGSV